MHVQPLEHFSYQMKKKKKDHKMPKKKEEKFIEGEALKVILITDSNIDQPVEQEINFKIRFFKGHRYTVMVSHNC